MDRLILKNAASLLLIQGASFLLPLVTFPYLVRVLGPESFGAMNFAAAITAYGALLADYGFNLSGSKLIAEARNDQNEINRIFWSIMSAKLLLAVIALALLLMACELAPPLQKIKGLVLAATPAILGAVLFPGWLLQGLERMSLTSFAAIGAQSLVIPFTFWLVHSPLDTPIAVFIRTSAPALAGATLLLWLTKTGVIRWRPLSWRNTYEALADGWHVFISSAAINLYTTSNQVILGFLCGTAQVGYFVAADRIRAAAQGLAGVLSNAVYPRVAAMMKTQRREAFRLAFRLMLIQGTTTFAGGVILWFASPYIVRLLMGPAFEASIPVLRWLAFVPFVVSLSNVFGIQLMLPLGLTKPFSRTLMASAVINFFLFVPLSLVSGASGGAAAMLLTECFVSVAMAIYLRSKGFI